MSEQKLKQSLFIVPVDTAYLIVIGQVIVQWGALENAFNGTLLRMFTHSKPTIEVDWQFKRLDKRFKMFADQTAICFSGYARIQAELLAIKDGMAKVQIDRNLLAHGRVATIFPKTGPTRFNAVGRSGGRDYDQDYTADQLRTVVTDLANLLGRLANLLDPNIDETIWPGWSPQELSVLRAFHLSSRPSIPIRGML